MIRIGIVGSDNSHAIAYSKLANVDRIAGDRCRAVAIWGQEQARTREVAETGRIETIVDRPEDMLGLVDLVLVVDRHGDLHAEHALPFLERGLPVYVDKPFAVRMEDCERMLAAARRSGALLTSFSALRYAPATDALTGEVGRIGPVKAAHFAGPCDFGSPYAGPFFYATHVAEVALRLIGEDVRTLLARRSGQTVAVQVTWADATLATLTYLGDAAYHFHAALFGTDGMAASEIAAGAGSYAAALKVILGMLESGTPPLTEEQMLRPIAMVHAIQRSLASGEAVDMVALLPHRHASG